MKLLTGLLFFGIFLWIGIAYIKLAYDPCDKNKTKIKVDLSDCFLKSFLVGVVIGIIGICVLIMYL